MMFPSPICPHIFTAYPHSLHIPSPKYYSLTIELWSLSIIHSSVLRHLGCFHSFIVQSITIMCIYFFEWIVFASCVGTNNGIIWSHESSIPFLRISICFLSELNIPNNSTWALLLHPIHQNIGSDMCHSHYCEVVFIVILIWISLLINDDKYFCIFLVAICLTKMFISSIYSLMWLLILLILILLSLCILNINLVFDICKYFSK